MVRGHEIQERVGKMLEMEKVCSLLIDEVYKLEGGTQLLEDFGFLGRTPNIANTTLVFMVRGIASNRKPPFC